MEMLSRKLVSELTQKLREEFGVGRDHGKCRRAEDLEDFRKNGGGVSGIL